MSQLSQAQEEAVALCHVVGLWGGGQGATTELVGGSKTHGRLMSSPRLRGQVTGWPEMGLGLERGSLVTHTPPSSLSLTRSNTQECKSSRIPASILLPTLTSLSQP